MSSIIYGKRVRCDWPLCTEEAEISLGDNWPGRSMPPGWLDLSSIVMIRQSGRPGASLNDICPEHSLMTLAFMAGVLATNEAPAAPPGEPFIKGLPET